VCSSLQEKSYSSTKYRLDWYKNTSAVGVRRKFGDKKQIWSFGARSGLDKDVLMQLGVECLKKLDAEMAEADVRQWVVGECAQS